MSDYGHSWRHSEAQIPRTTSEDPSVLNPLILNLPSPNLHYPQQDGFFAFDTTGDHPYPAFKTVGGPTLSEAEAEEIERLVSQ